MDNEIYIQKLIPDTIRFSIISDEQVVNPIKIFSEKRSSIKNYGGQNEA